MGNFTSSDWQWWVIIVVAILIVSVIVFTVGYISGDDRANTAFTKKNEEIKSLRDVALLTASLQTRIIYQQPRRVSYGDPTCCVCREGGH